ncbi:PHD finger domain-containing protein [Coccidioides immitis RS]|uniref:Chromatin modification-related protein n=1 Tax=Coccidioides immitis (strain RS) TaxID=246410 RepID=J3KDK4_COCIM|nr:PHD finger domain-containing protein [Coccidioides immitis RS]EAS33451.3 PHD finger domain-containing protein [Coccidioides immitis RS]
MSHTEDCSTVLEQFVHDVANLPAEINHLMEEIQAKDKIIQECRAIINSRDASLQKFIKLNGSHSLNPKEESYSSTILQNMDRCQTLQDEKIALSEKAAVILDRHVKKLDIKIRDLQNDGVLPNDPPIPSLFGTKGQLRDPTKSILFNEPGQADAYPSPLNPTSGNAALPANLLQRLNSAAAAAAGISATGGTGGRSSAPATPAAALHFQQRHRESSAGATENKRRRLNASIGNLPAAPSGLRQSSLGPGTPKGGTPGATRAGSAGPRATAVTKKATIKKVAPHQQVRKIKAGAAATKATKRSSSGNGRLKAVSANAGSRKRSPASATSVVEEEDESMLSSADLSDSENNVSRRQAGRDSDEEMEDEEDETGEDTKVYCTCRSVSHGDMVACDNDNCPYEWFHWKCVGLTREPLGTWYCEECRKNLGK